MNQNVATLLAALIGGLLAIIGGFMANYITGKTAAKNEKRIFMRNKIEELCNLLEG